MNFIDDFTAWLAGFFQSSVDWLHQSLIDISTYYVLISTKFAYESAIYALTIGVGVVANIIEELRFNELINEYYYQLPSDVVQFSNFLGLPAAINLILSSLLLRFVMGKLSFL